MDLLKLLQLLGEDVAPSDKPWYLMPGYGEKELLLTPDGEVRGGTISALVERLTYHYAVGQPRSLHLPSYGHNIDP